MSSDLGPIISMLADNLGQLHTADGEQLNFVPLQHDSDLAKQLRKGLAEGIVLLLDQHGHINHPQPIDSALPPSIVKLTCGLCSGELLTVNTSVPLNGRNVLTAMAQRDPECRTRHGLLTPDEIRLRIQAHMDAEDQEHTDSV